METLLKCPVCGHSAFKDEFKAIDHTVSRETFLVQSCLDCGLFFTNPRPDQSEIGRYYQSEDYISHSNKAVGITGRLYKIVRGITLKGKLRLITRLNAGAKGHILDIGCGTGEFLDICKRAGWDTMGIEPSEGARGYGIKRYGLRIDEESTLDSLPEQGYDIICMWHVLEHVPDLHSRLSRIKWLIRPGGAIIVAVPNRQSFDASLYEENWAAWDVPRHFYHFRPSDIERLAGMHQLKVSAILPMKFDAYYVSMLSEKYRRGSISLLRSTWNGLRSNMRARKQPGLFSSQIYVLKP